MEKQNLQMESERELSTKQNPENERASGHTISILENADQKCINLMKEKIKEMPKSLNKSAGNSSCCIFRVPQSLFELNEKVYHPHIVSIGPYHHGKQQLNMIQEHKWRYLSCLLARTQRHNIGLDDFFNAVAGMEEKIRDSYSETIGLTRQELIEMMVVDGCFIIELICRVGMLVMIERDDPIFNLAWMFPLLQQDLLKLENQVPYFVLQILFDLSISSLREENDPSLTKLFLGFFNYMAQRPDDILLRYINTEGKHLLDLFRLTLSPSSQDAAISPFVQYLVSPIDKLRSAGIRFKPRKADSWLDIKFSNGDLEIPPLTIDDFTTSFLFNCVAFEQCYSHCSKHITAYVTFMACLVKVPADAEYLCDHKIIENYIGSNDEVTEFFNNVSKDVVFDIERCYLAGQFVDVTEYYKKHYHRSWRASWASFKHTYFDTPWSFISALAASILLILTMIQTFFSVYGYVSPPK